MHSFIINASNITLFWTWSWDSYIFLFFCRIVYWLKSTIICLKLCPTLNTYEIVTVCTYIMDNSLFLYVLNTIFIIYFLTKLWPVFVEAEETARICHWDMEWAIDASLYSTMGVEILWLKSTVSNLGPLRTEAQRLHSETSKDIVQHFLVAKDIRSDIILTRLRRRHFCNQTLWGLTRPSMVPPFLKSTQPHPHITFIKIIICIL